MVRGGVRQRRRGGGSVVDSVHVGISKISCSLLAQQEKKQTFGRDTMYE
jgi:hypothetical protein